jgi:uncharacterized membrane protein HdeD (DUF308 family)
MLAGKRKEGKKPVLSSVPLDCGVVWKKGVLCMSNASFFDNARSRFRAGFAEVDRKWGWYFALGVFLIVLGLIASYMAVATAMVSVVVLGWVLLVAGAGLVVLSFLTGKWSGFLLTLAAGVISAVTGIEILSNSAFWCCCDHHDNWNNADRIRHLSVGGVHCQFPNWGWSLVSGIVDFALGAILLRNWQNTSLWFLGLVIGIDLILHGFAWIMFSLRLHSLVGELGITEAGRPAA